VEPSKPSGEAASDATPSHGWLARLGIVLGLFLVLLLGVLVYFQRSTSNRLRLALEELDRTDPGWRLPDVEAARREVPAAENSALRIKAITAAMPKSWPPQDLDERLRGAPPELLAPADYARLQRELAPMAGVSAEARKLAELPYGRFPLVLAHNPIATLLPDQQESRRVASLLAYDARQLAQARDMKQALHSCRAGLNVARAIGDEPFLVSHLVRIACTSVACASAERVLAQGEPDPADLEKLQQALELEEQDNGLLAALRGERGVLHQLLVLIEDGEVDVKLLTFGTGVSASALDRFLPAKARYDARAEHPEILALLTERIEAAKKPLHEQVAVDRAFEARMRDQARTHWITRVLMPAVDKVSQAFRREYANLRCLAALVAAERFRRAKGRWPDTLEELRPDFLAEIPPDPYDGKPLRYKRLADGVLVYTVGPDGTDDGGALDRDNPVRAGTDLGCQLWDVARRRQPPRPKPAPEGPAR
jgi:hypothetical protein